MEARIKTFDQIKGLVMILVILEHGLYYLYYYGVSDNILYSITCNIIQLFHMPLMFCVSGFLAGFNKKNKSQSIIKDVIALYIPYVIVVYLFLLERILGEVLFGVVGETPIDLSLSGLLQRLIHADGIAWFILSLFIIKTLINLIKDLLNRYLLLIISILLVVIIYYFSLENVYLVKYMPCYVIGYIFNKYNYPKSAVLSVISVILLSSLCVYASIYSVNLLVANSAGVLVFYLLIQYPQILPKGKLIEISGLDSLVLFFIHDLTEFVLLVVLDKFLNNGLIILTIYLLITFILFFFIRFLYQNVKAFKWIEYIFYPYKLYLKINNK